MASPIQGRPRQLSPVENPTPIEIPAELTPRIPLPESVSRASGVSLKGRTAPLGSRAGKEFPHSPEGGGPPAAGLSDPSKLKGALPISRACHDVSLKKLQKGKMAVFTSSGKGSASQVPITLAQSSETVTEQVNTAEKITHTRHVDDRPAETHIQQLLEKAQKKGIFISREQGRAQITRVKGCPEEEQWELLKKIHAFIPIIHLECGENGNVESLLFFLQSNQSLISLDLGKSPNMTDEELEGISQHLPKLKSFSIQSAKVTSIPQSICRQVETLICMDCPVLATLNAPEAAVVKCMRCKALTALHAQAALAVNCDNCLALAILYAPAASEISCDCCRALTTIDAPAATTLNCSRCVALTKIEAPKALTLDCIGCRALTTLNTRAATTVRCRNCLALETLYAPRATELFFNNCQALKILYAPKVAEINCDNYRALTIIYAPEAKAVHCNGCTALQALHAGAAALVECSGCIVLATMDAGAARRITGWLDTALSSEARLKILIRLRRMAIMACYSEGSQDFHELMRGVGETQDRPLYRWFVDACNFTVPANFVSADDRRESKQKIDHFVKKLIGLAVEEGVAKEESLQWFKELKKTESLQKRMKRVIWLGALLMCSVPDKNLFSDMNAFSTLKVIANLDNPFLQQKLSDALLSMYEDDESKPEEMWKENKKLKGHQTLPHLLFAATKLEKAFVQSLLRVLETRHYQDRQVITPILEMISMLPSLPSTQQEKLLKFILKAAPVRKRGERQNVFDDRVIEHRKEQSKLVRACRDLLFFGTSHVLINVKDESDLFEKHKTTLQQIVGVKEEFAEKFIDSFRSKRYSDPLPTYAARLHILADGRLVGLLGKFVNAHLEGSFPASRYDLSCNPHLAALFKDNQELLDKWISPLVIDLAEQPQERSSIEFKRDAKGLQPKTASWKTIESTELWEDLFLSGTEVSHSCQDIGGDPNYNKCLLAYILDGKNKLIIVRDAEGTIAARSILRILCDKETGKPVLFMERIYTKTRDSLLHELIRRGCGQKAKEMGLPLVGSPNDFADGLFYKGTLSALGGPVPFEYVDALFSIQRNGLFDIKDSRVLYMPK